MRRLSVHMPTGRGSPGANAGSPNGALTASVNLAKVGGVSAILATVCGGGAYIAVIAGGDAHAPVGWLIICALLLQMVAALGFFWAVRNVGSLAWVGLAAWLVGILLAVVGQVFLIAVDNALPRRSVQTTEPAIESAPAPTFSPSTEAALAAPLSVARAYYDAYNAQDGEGLAAIFADDIVLSFEPGYGGFTGKEAVLREQLDEVSYKPRITLSDPTVQGNTVIGQHSFRADPDTLMTGLMELVVEDGKITRLQVTLDRETVVARAVVGIPLHVSQLTTGLGLLLALGIGLALFALAALRAPQVPRWVGRTGLVVALLAWPAWLSPVTGAYELGSGFWSLFSFSVLAFLLWFAATGVTFARLPIHEGGIALPQQAQPREDGEPAAHPRGLTSREVEVLRLIAAGMTNKEIAGALVISERTVAQHARNIFNKMGVANRAKAVARSGLLQE